MIAFFRKRTAILAIAATLISLTGCTFHHPTQAEQDQKLKQQAADATATARKNAELVGARARIAAADAERKLNVIASGVQQGWKNGKPVARPVDVNTASRVDLVRLPGISVKRADRIIAARPYSSPRQLVRKGILTQQEYDRISSRLTAQ